jgi:ribose/xylose/arabinose/galactoside ABC-type transport system permease subunit
MGFMQNARASARKFGATHNLNNYGILIGFILIVIILSFANPHFLTYGNVINVLRQVACIGIATVAVGVLIIMNCIDLSIGSLFALCGIAAGIMVSTGKEGLGLPAVVGYIVGILTGVVVGLFNGVTVAKGKIPAFIVTMGSMSIARGLALILAHGMPVGSFPDQFTFLGTASVDGGNLIPWSVIIFLAVILLMNFVMKKRALGRYIFAIGSNEDAAIAAGINSQKIKIMAYLVEGGLVGLGATLLASRLKSAAPALGNGYELDAIAGAIIGGVSFTGGIGSVWGMVLGAMIIGVINNGMDLLGVPAFYKQVVKGAIIIVAVLLDRRRAGRG